MASQARGGRVSWPGLPALVRARIDSRRDTRLRRLGRGARRARRRAQQLQPSGWRCPGLRLGRAVAARPQEGRPRHRRHRQRCAARRDRWRDARGVRRARRLCRPPGGRHLRRRLRHCSTRRWGNQIAPANVYLRVDLADAEERLRATARSCLLGVELRRRRGFDVHATAPSPTFRDWRRRCGRPSRRSRRASSTTSPRPTWRAAGSDAGSATSRWSTGSPTPWPWRPPTST